MRTTTLVQRCTIAQVYDSGLSNQGESTGVWTQYNITYINNIVSDCACSYEYCMARLPTYMKSSLKTTPA